MIARKDRQGKEKSGSESLPIDSDTFLNLDEMLLKQRSSNKPKPVSMTKPYCFLNLLGSLISGLYNYFYKFH